jgi:hypothetical protein
MIKRGLSLADVLDAYEAGGVTQLAVMRWLGCRRYVDFLIVLDVNHRHLPRGRLPLRPLRRQRARNRLRPDWRSRFVTSNFGVLLAGRGV